MEKNNKVENTESKFVGNPQYRGLAYKTDLNRDTVRFIKKYKKRIGDYLEATVEGMLTRRGELVLMIANAGGGKTYTVLKLMKKLSAMPENDNVRYVIAVPNRNQSMQNEKAYRMFGAKSVVGAKDGSRKIHVDPEYKIISCVYDKALEVVETLKSLGHEVVLVLDESHKMIADANFRGKAIADLELASKTADQAIMMTATPRRCLEYYKYDSIYHMVDEKVNRNIEKFSVILSDNVKLTLIREVERILDKGEIKVNVEYERYTDTLEEVPAETLLEMLEGKKYKTVRETEYYMGTEKRMSKVLIRLNSIEEIDAMIEVFKSKGHKCEKLTAKEKDGDIFKSIEEKSLIEGEARIYFCTSVVECGVSLENQELHLIEVIRSSRDFDTDNTTQFFARARKSISEGILIIPDYIDKDIKEEIKQQAKDLKEKGVEFDVVKAYEERKRDFSKIKIIEDSMKDSEKYEKELNAIKSRYDNIARNTVEKMNKAANADYIMAKTKLDLAMEYDGIEDARRYLKAEIINQARNNAGYINVIEADLDTLTIAIDTKKVVDKAFKEFDKKIVRYNPGMLIDLFEDKIFYEEVHITHHKVEEERAKDESYDKECEKATETIKENKKATKEEKLMIQDKSREMLKDEEFIKLLDDVLEDKICKENISEYTDRYTIKDILDFKDSNICDEYKTLIEIFSKEEAIHLLTVSVITSKALDKRFKQVKKKYKTLTEKQFKEKMNIVPALDEMRYLKFSEIDGISETKHFVDNHNKRGHYRRGLKDKHSTILDVILPAKLDKNNKQVTIRATRDILLKLNIELVNRGIYKDDKMEKAIKEINKNAEKFNTSSDLYADINIKKLEKIYSSRKNSDIKMLNEISKVFNLANNTNGYRINGVIKTFDMASIISSIH